MHGKETEVSTPCLLSPTATVPYGRARWHRAPTPYSRAHSWGGRGRLIIPGAPSRCSRPQSCCCILAASCGIAPCMGRHYVAQSRRHRARLGCQRLVLLRTASGCFRAKSRAVHDGMLLSMALRVGSRGSTLHKAAHCALQPHRTLHAGQSPMQTLPRVSGLPRCQTSVTCLHTRTNATPH